MTKSIKELEENRKRTGEKSRERVQFPLLDEIHSVVNDLRGNRTAPHVSPLPATNLTQRRIKLNTRLPPIRVHGIDVR